MYLNERRFGSAILTMFRPLHLLILLSLFQFSMAAEPIVINDSALSRDLGKKIGELVDASKTTGAKELIEQLSRKKPKRVFWGCSNYPECEFVMGDEPIKAKCKKCGHPLLSKRKKDEVVVCPSCNAEGEEVTD